MIRFSRRKLPFKKRNSITYSKIRNCSIIPIKLFFNFSCYVLSEAEKSLLQKDLNFSIPPKKLNHAFYFVKFELIYWDIRNLQVLSAENLDFTKTKTKDIALSSFRTYNNSVQQHLSKGESNALKSLKFDLKTNKSSFTNLTKVTL